MEREEIMTNKQASRRRKRRFVRIFEFKHLPTGIKAKDLKFYSGWIGNKRAIVIRSKTEQLVKCSLQEAEQFARFGGDWEYLRWEK
jgi:hypothetical protein